MKINSEIDWYIKSSDKEIELNKIKSLLMAAYMNFIWIKLNKLHELLNWINYMSYYMLE